MDEPHPGKTTFVIMVSPLPAGPWERHTRAGLRLRLRLRLKGARGEGRWQGQQKPSRRKSRELRRPGRGPGAQLRARPQQRPLPTTPQTLSPHGEQRLPQHARTRTRTRRFPTPTPAPPRSETHPEALGSTHYGPHPQIAPSPTRLRSHGDLHTAARRPAPPRPSSSLRRRPPARLARSSRAEGEPHGRARPGLPEESRAALEGGACGGPLARQAEEPRAPPAGPGAGPQLRGAPRAPAPAEQLPKAKAAPPGSGVTQNLSLNPSERSRCEPGVPSLGSQYRTWPASVATRPRTDSSTQHTSPGPGSRKLTSTNWSSRKRTHVGTHLCRHQSANWLCKLSRPSACRQTGAGFQPGAVPDLGEEATRRTSGNPFSLPKLRLKGVAGGGGVWGGRKEGRKESVSLQRTEPCRTTCDPDHTHRVTPDMGPC
ncbi:uncharacterized protein LOC142017898 [Carettochelys insculpta]|uniref:uncharacterized protein LOC142017898 n=1 Tax=Carettochelys insculpta TaxID=44489 RepID=UPI003EB85C61